MDLSKLPKLSQSDAPPLQPPPDHAPVAVRSDYARPSEGVAAEVWISIVVAFILMLASPYTLQWLISKFSSYRPSFLPITDSQTGQEIPYSQSTFFFGHLCVFLFALVLIMD